MLSAHLQFSIYYNFVISVCFNSALFLSDEFNFALIANNYKTASRRKLKFSHNVDIST